MDAKELRIGNKLLNTNNNKIITVDADTLHFIACCDGDCQYKPIPLTEEWLLKFGFENKAGIFYTKVDFGIRKYKNDYGFFFIADNINSILLSDIKYVHQLQNLYHALTGNELTIKL